MIEHPSFERFYNLSIMISNNYNFTQPSFTISLRSYRTYLLRWHRMNSTINRRKILQSVNYASQNHKFRVDSSYQRVEFEFNNKLRCGYVIQVSSTRIPHELSSSFYKLAQVSSNNTLKRFTER
jgi:hypothetical protein